LWFEGSLDFLKPFSKLLWMKCDSCIIQMLNKRMWFEFSFSLRFSIFYNSIHLSSIHISSLANSILMNVVVSCHVQCLKYLSFLTFFFLQKLCEIIAWKVNINIECLMKMWQHHVFQVHQVVVAFITIPSLNIVNQGLNWMGCGAPWSWKNDSW